MSRVESAITIFEAVFVLSGEERRLKSSWFDGIYPEYDPPVKLGERLTMKDRMG
jgi:hypothetical protein